VPHDRFDGLDHVGLVGIAEVSSYPSRRLALLQPAHSLLRPPDHLKILLRNAGGALEVLLD
jgi:hypothetical protein